MPNEYTLSDLVKIAGVSPRTVRYYIAQGLLPSPTQAGPNARYSEAHLDRLRLIKRLQAAHLPLAEIRNRLESLPDDQVATLAESAPAHEPAGSALTYIESLLNPRPAALAMPLSAPAPANQAPDRAPAEPDRAQWERISLDPDIELHVRRPLTRQHSKQVERLIAIARELLKEE